jgi:hypothetical protein
VAQSAGVAKSVPTSPFLPTVSHPQGVPVSRLPQRRDRVPSGAGQASRTTPRQGRAGGCAWDGWARSSWP